MLNISPDFITSLLFKVASIYIISTMIKQYTDLYISIGIVVSFLTAYRYTYLIIFLVLLTAAQARSTMAKWPCHH